MFPAEVHELTLLDLDDCDVDCGENTVCNDAGLELRQCSCKSGFVPAPGYQSPQTFTRSNTGVIVCVLPGGEAQPVPQPTPQPVPQPQPSPPSTRWQVVVKVEIPLACEEKTHLTLVFLPKPI